jgi:hypothetical protein
MVPSGDYGHLLAVDPVPPRFWDLPIVNATASTPKYLILTECEIRNIEQINNLMIIIHFRCYYKEYTDV